MELDTLSIISCSKLSIPFFNFMLSFYTYYPHPSVYHQYSIPTILQVVTPINFLKKRSFVSFVGLRIAKHTPSPHLFFQYSNMEA